jgi:hypothetical protein
MLVSVVPTVVEGIATLPEILTEPDIVAPPWSTMRPFLTLNSFAIIYISFTSTNSVAEYKY